MAASLSSEQHVVIGGGEVDVERLGSTGSLVLGLDCPHSAFGAENSAKTRWFIWWHMHNQTKIGSGSLPGALAEAPTGFRARPRMRPMIRAPLAENAHESIPLVDFFRAQIPGSRQRARKISGFSLAPSARNRLRGRGIS